MGNNGTFLISIIVGAVAAYWVYNDAKKRPMNPTVWAIGTFLICIVFLPLYLILRKPETGSIAGTPGVPPQPTPLPPTYTPAPQQGYQQPPQYTPPPPTYIPPPPTYTPPQPGAAPAAGPAKGKFCPSCGAPHEGTVKFCPNCGAAS
jgi:hypothetical protein